MDLISLQEASARLGALSFAIPGLLAGILIAIASAVGATELPILTAGYASMTPRHADVAGSGRGPLPPGHMPASGECSI